MSHILPSSDENTRGKEIFLSDKTCSNLVGCFLDNALVSSFSVKYFTGVFHFNGCIEHCYGWNIGRKWKFSVSQCCSGENVFSESDNSVGMYLGWKKANTYQE